MAHKRNGEANRAAHAPAQQPSPQPAAEQAADGGDDRKPVHRIRMKLISAAIWRNRTAEGTYWYSVTFQRSYRDEQSNWKTSESFGGTDLLVLAEVARAAFAWVIREQQSPNNAVQAAAREGGSTDNDPVPF